MKRFLALLVAACLIVPVFGTRSARAQSSVSGERCSFDPSDVVDVVLLLDQSGSLRRTDPDDQRVAGAQSVVRAYGSIASRVSEVRIAVAGFGEDFSSAGWTRLDDGSLDEILRVTAEFAGVDDQNHTDYVYALAGAHALFGEPSDATCRTLFWFTDGEHDLDRNYLGDGLARHYLDGGEVVTVENFDEIEARMPDLVCGPSGYAVQLGQLSVSTQVMLLGGGSAMDDASRRVLRGMGGDPSENCGFGVGSFESVDSADELPYRMACLAHQGGQELVLEPPADRRISVTNETLSRSGLPSSLVSQLLIIARGGPEAPPTLDASTGVGPEQIAAEPNSGTAEIRIEPNEPVFESIVVDVDEACAFATLESPVLELQQETPTLRVGETGEFAATAQGPHGPLSEEDSDLFELVADASVTAESDGWSLVIPELPSPGEYVLEARLEGPVASEAVRLSYTVNEQLNAPTIVSQPEPVIGEGVGPFSLPLQVEGRDGGELCLGQDRASLPTSDGEVQVDVRFGGEGLCIEVPPAGVVERDVVVSLAEPVFANGTIQLDTTSSPSDRPDRHESGVLSVAIDVTPEANTVLVGVIVVGLILLLVLVIWFVLYGINRLVSRIPDPRRNGVRYADFSAHIGRSSEGGGLHAEVANVPADTDLRIPRRTPSELRAGALRIQRRVPIVPWRVPYATVSMGSEKVAVDLGRGFVRRALFGDRSLRGRPSDALGPLAAVAISAQQWERLSSDGRQNLAGVVLVDLSERRGEVASRVVGAQLEESLERIRHGLNDVWHDEVERGEDE